MPQGLYLCHEITYLLRGVTFFAAEDTDLVMVAEPYRFPNHFEREVRVDNGLDARPRTYTDIVQFFHGPDTFPVGTCTGFQVVTSGKCETNGYKPLSGKHILYGRMTQPVCTFGKYLARDSLALCLVHAPEVQFDGLRQGSDTKLKWSPPSLMIFDLHLVNSVLNISKAVSVSTRDFFKDTMMPPSIPAMILLLLKQ